MQNTSFKAFLESTMITNESLSLDQTIEVIKTRGQKFRLTFGDISQHVLYRGTKLRFDPDAILQTPRTDRRPLTMNKNYHEAADDFFEKEFGIRFRSSAIFTAAEERIASFYGDPHVVIPLDDFDFCWSPDYSDLYMYFEREITHQNDVTKLSRQELIDKAIYLLEGTKFYFNDKTSINKYFESHKKHEMMIKCDEYLILRPEFFQKVVGEL